ncbi:MAG: hypothetical protein ABWZ26_01515 [Candidatus Nanopelagicales bacterium]
MPLWLLLLVAGIVLAIIGFAGAGQVLVIIGVVLLLIGLIGTLAGRRGARV